jgi:hypothetical protein
MGLVVLALFFLWWASLVFVHARRAKGLPVPLAVGVCLGSAVFAFFVASAVMTAISAAMPNSWQRNATAAVALSVWLAFPLVLLLRGRKRGWIAR